MPPEPRFFIRATPLDPGLRCDVTASSPENISRKNCTYPVNYFPRPIDTKGRKAAAAPAFFSSLTMDQASHVYSLVQRIDMGKRVTRAWGFADHDHLRKGRWCNTEIAHHRPVFPMQANKPQATVELQGLTRCSAGMPGGRVGPPPQPNHRRLWDGKPRVCARYGQTAGCLRRFRQKLFDSRQTRGDPGTESHGSAS